MIHPQRKFNIYNSIKRAIMQKWSVLLSSDGYANYGTGNVLTSDNSGLNGFANPNAWCVLDKTINTQQYQFCVQTDGYMGLRLKYSKFGFNGGVDNLISSPTASDQQVLLGGGTDASPTYQQVIGGTLNFNANGVIISLDTVTNVLNFTLRPIILVPATKPPASKPVINKILT
jgi:hypothetical protein